MRHDIVMPKLGLTMTEGSISEWKVAPGASVAAGDIIVVIETDKVAHDVEAERDGVIAEIVVGEGETVPVGTVVARVDSAESTHCPSEDAHAGRVVATPYARRQAAAMGADLAAIEGSGPNGRIVAADVLAAARPEKATAPSTDARAHAVHRRAPSSTHAAMARRLSASKHGIPHFYLASEVEVSALQAARAAANATANGTHLTITDYVVAAAGRALRDVAEANTVWAEGELVTYTASDVGLAIATPQGLYAPLLRDVGDMALEQVAVASRDLVRRAHAGVLTAADMDGAAITVSNAGMHDVTWMAPIIAPGQSAILGVGSVRQLFRPDTEGRPTLHREITLVLAADHRVFDGVGALLLLNAIAGYLRSPEQLATS